MGTIQLPWPVSKLDDASLDIAATLKAVGDAVKAVPTENKDLVQRAVEGGVAIMQKIAARDNFGEKSEGYTLPQFRKLCNVLAKASEDLADDITIKDTIAKLAGNIATVGMTAVMKTLAKLQCGDALNVFVPPTPYRPQAGSRSLSTRSG